MPSKFTSSSSQRWWFRGALVVIAVGLVGGLGLLYARAAWTSPYGVELPKVVAKVGDHPIGRDEVYRRMRQYEGMKAGGFEKKDGGAMERLAARVIDTLIQQRLLLGEAERKEIAVSEAEIDAQYAQTQNSLGGREAFEDHMRKGRTDARTLRDDIRQFLAIQKLDETLQGSVNVEDEEIRTFFESNKARLLQDHARVSHILVETPEKAEEVLRLLSVDHREFADVARRYSIDGGSKAAGGSLGWIVKGQTEPELERAVFALPPGEIGSPVRTRFGYHVIWVQDVQSGGQQTLADHRDHIVQILRQQKWQAAKAAWLAHVAVETPVWRAPGVPVSSGDAGS